MNIAAVISETARRHPERPAIVFDDSTISYQDLMARAQTLSVFLRAQSGLDGGSPIAIYLPNVPEFAVAYLAIVRLGMVAVSIGAMLKEREVLHVLQDSGARFLITNEALCPNAATLTSSLPELGVVWLGPDTITTARGAQHMLQNGAAKAAAEIVDVESDTPAAILYTSGTTGPQKGAVLTHGNLVSNTAATARSTGAVTGDRHLLFLPLSHCFGQNFILNTTLRTGGTIVLMKRFELANALNEVERSKVTHFYGVPTVFRQVLDASEAPRLLQSVRYFFSAAATMPVEVAKRFRERFGRPIYEGYGLTETSPLASYNHETSYRIGSIGVPIEHVEMKIVSDDGSECGPGVWGEICIKGPNVMSGYYGRSAETAQVLRDGWFHTGDIGYRDAEGYYFLVDRVKDMINRSGFKIWPREVEEVIYEHPGVRECAVVAAAHAIHGESVVAYVVRYPGQAVTAEELRLHCGTHLANYKVPERFVFDVEIPKNPSGKVLKRELRRLANEGSA